MKNHIARETAQWPMCSETWVFMIRNGDRDSVQLVAGRRCAKFFLRRHAAELVRKEDPRHGELSLEHIRIGRPGITCLTPPIDLNSLELLFLLSCQNCDGIDYCTSAGATHGKKEENQV
jgi:hypothetical protein